MKRKQAKKAAPIKLAWLDQVIGHDWPEKPARATVVSVAAVLQKYGDPAGGGICPARGTIAATLRIKPQTLDDVLELMIGEGMLVKTGRTRYGTIIYRLCLSGHTSSIDAVPDAVPHAVARETHNPQPSTVKGEGGGDTPAADTPTAVVAGTNTDNIKTSKPASTLGDEHADLTVASFVTDFDAAFAKRERSSTVAAQRLEPTHSKLRTEIVAKIDAGWPQDHLIDRIITSLPADDRKISTLTGLVATKLSRLPDQPDYTARQIITDREIAAEAARKTREADRKHREAERQRQRDLEALQAQNLLRAKTKRRDDAIARYRRALEDYTETADIEAAVQAYVADIDAEADLDDDPAASRLGDWIIEQIDDDINTMRETHDRTTRDLDAKLGELTMAFYYFQAGDGDNDAEIDRIITGAGLDAGTMRKPSNIGTAIAAIDSYIEQRWGDEIRATGKTIHDLANEKMSATVIDADLNRIPETAGDMW